MSVLSSREVLPRTFSHKFGESPTAERKFMLTLSAPVGHQQVLNTVGIFHGTPHPEFGYLLCTEGSVTEPDPYHAEVTYRYEVPAIGTQDSAPNPLGRADIWSFSTGGVGIPALTYFDGSTQKPLVNSAFDFFEGAMTDEAELRATISGNRAQFPVSAAVSVTNCINSDSFLGAAKYQWKCQGISAQQQVEVINGFELKYWSVSVELVYRASGWELLLPNIGWNYLTGGKKERAYVLDPEDKTTKIASSNPVALTTQGDIASPGTPPEILRRRVHREIAFAPFFGNPPS
jgi:hypothetical protein